MDEIENTLEELQDSASDHEDKLTKLSGALSDLRNEFYRNNFPANQAFVKASTFSTSLQIPTKTALPTTCIVGQLCSYNGKLYHCSAANTWQAQT